MPISPLPPISCHCSTEKERLFLYFLEYMWTLWPLWQIDYKRSDVMLVLDLAINWHSSFHFLPLVKFTSEHSFLECFLYKPRHHSLKILSSLDFCICKHSSLQLPTVNQPASAASHVKCTLLDIQSSPAFGLLPELKSNCNNMKKTKLESPSSELNL